MVRTPDGKCYWPSFPIGDLLKIADIRQIQLKQISLDTIEVLLAMDGQLSSEQETRLKEILHTSLNYRFNIKFSLVEVVPVQKNGKYEDFISLL